MKIKDHQKNKEKTKGHVDRLIKRSKDDSYLLT